MKLSIQTKSLSKQLTAISLAVSVVLLNGCATHNNDLPLAETKSLTEFSSAASFQGESQAWPAERWWAVYGDQQLNNLIDEALAANPSMSIAQARFQQAQAVAGLAKSSLSPSIGVSASVSGQKMTYNGVFPAAFVPQGWNDYASVGLDLSWDFDFWGQNKAAVSAAVSSVAAEQAELAQTRLLIASSVALTYVELNRLYSNLSTAQHALQIRTKTTELFTKRQAHGLENIGTVKQAEARQAGSQAQVVAIEGRITLVRQQLAALLGAGPDRGKQFTVPDLNLDKPLIVPDDASLNLVGRRPDIVAAKWRVSAQQSRIAVSEAAFYPNISISALIGFDALGINNLLDKDAYMGNVGPAIYLPIFTGDRLENQLYQEQAGYNAAVASYNSTLVHALEQVAGAVTQQHTLAQQITLARTAAEAARQAHKVAQNRYEGGMANYLQVLSAEDTRLMAEETLTNLVALSLQYDVQLQRALGGGYTAPESSNQPS